MKKIFLAMAALVCCMSMNAQSINVYKDSTIINSYPASKTNTVVFASTSSLLPGKFSVSDTKQVRFTRGNLYWNGSDFKLEANQTDYPTTWSANHVGHFFYTSINDYKLGNDSYMPYAETYGYYTPNFYAFWCGENTPLTAEGTTGLYALTRKEWLYVLNSRANASQLKKFFVTVTNGEMIYENCVILAPDDFADTLCTSYTLDEVNAAGLVCLPAAGLREGTGVYCGSEYGLYHAASTGEAHASELLRFDSQRVGTAGGACSDGYSLRLVCDSESDNAQVFSGFSIYKSDGNYDTYTIAEADSVVFSEPRPYSELLPGKFSVSDTKQVQFTSGNLYWDGSAFKIEANQTDYPTVWDTAHVGLFFWTNLKDYQTGTASYMPYAESHNYSMRSMDDKFWCGEDNPLTVGGTTDLYALSADEWEYLFKSRKSASRLYKTGVDVYNGEITYKNCIVIAPDDFTGTLKMSYTIEVINAIGLVCLPSACASRIDGLTFIEDFNYWTATPDLELEYIAYVLCGDGILYRGLRKAGCCLRLVRNF